MIGCIKQSNGSKKKKKKKKKRIECIDLMKVKE